MYAVLGALLQGAGSYYQGEAQKNEIAKQQQLSDAYKRAYGQYDNWSRAGDDALAARMGDLSAERYGNYTTLASALGSPERAGASAAGSADASARMNAAMARLPASPGRAMTGAGGAYGAWGDRATETNVNPVLQSRMALLADARGNRASSLYDQTALDANQDASIDINRRAGEAQRQEAVLAAYRRAMLEKAGLQYDYKGPGASYYNAQLTGQMLGLAGSGVQAYGSGRPGGYSNSTYATDRLQGPAR